MNSEKISQITIKTFIPPHPLKTAVLFMVFNRPNTTKQVFEAIRQAKPPRLYVSADGPRADKVGEAEKCEEARKIATQVDWECEVKTLFRDKNLGCKYAPSGAINWFFKNEEEGIILEDDCLPSQSFFWFCEELLERYRGDMRIMIVSGYNKQETWKQDKYDYFFSYFGGIWGWASWRRAWNLYDGEMKDLDCFIENNYFEFLLGKRLGNIRKKQMLNVIQKNIDAWDFPWGFAMHANSGLACVPSKNLVENIGFGKDATHTLGTNTDMVKRHEISFPLEENKFIVSDSDYDDKFFGYNSLLYRITNFLGKVVFVFKNTNLRVEAREWKDYEYFDEIWKLRIQKLISYIEDDDKKICDIGCGKQWAKQFLPNSVEYIPVDYKYQSPDTIICDLNHKELPSEQCLENVVLCSGVLEYIDDINWFISSLSKTNKVIASYCTLEKHPILKMRRRYGWKNDLSLQDLVNIFLKQGFVLKKIDLVNDNTTFCFKRNIK